MQKDKIFRNSLKQENQVDVLINGDYEFFPGIWPLVDENYKLTDFVAVGNKNGIPWTLLNKIKTEYKNKFKFIYNCQNGPCLVSDYKLIENAFDGIFDTDYKIKNPKRLNCNHSMLVRSLPCDGLFWEPVPCTKEYDFNMLTIAKVGSLSKRWDRGEDVCYKLCKEGFKGAIYSQNGNCMSLISKRLEGYVKARRLVVRDGAYSSNDFHKETCKALCTIFPNNVDAFPKFIIESLLADRFIIISDDLLLGRDALKKLGEPIVTEVSFKDLSYRKIISVLSNLKNGFRKVSPRKAWLEKYDFNHIVQKWAIEFNKVFGTNFKKLWYMNHNPRLSKNKESL